MSVDPSNRDDFLNQLIFSGPLESDVSIGSMPVNNKRPSDTTFTPQVAPALRQAIPQNMLVDRQQPIVSLNNTSAPSRMAIPNARLPTTAPVQQMPVDVQVVDSSRATLGMTTFIFVF